MSTPTININNSNVPNQIQLETSNIKERIKPIISQMCLDIVIDKPPNITLYMIKWLQNYGGYSSTSLMKTRSASLPSKMRPFCENPSKSAIFLLILSIIWSPNNLCITRKEDSIPPIPNGCPTKDGWFFLSSDMKEQ